MRRIVATVWCLAALLALTACATRDKQVGVDLAQQPMAANPAAEPAKSEAQSPDPMPAWRWGSGFDREPAQPAAELPGVVRAPAQSPGQRQAGRAALGALGGALMGALVPLAVFAPGGPIGVAIGLSLAPAGAVAGAAVGLAQSTSSK